MKTAALGVLVGAALGWCPGRAAAALGEPASSVSTDRRALSAVQQATTQHAAFRVEELTSHANVVREYVSPSGVIFAVAWRGMTHPDLGALLGSYASEYRNATSGRARTPGRPSRRTATDHLVVETWGHMRDLQGRAYLPSLMPPGVTADDIR